MNFSLKCHKFSIQSPSAALTRLLLIWIPTWLIGIIAKLTGVPTGLVGIALRWWHLLGTRVISSSGWLIPDVFLVLALWLYAWLIVILISVTRIVRVLVSLWHLIRLVVKRCLLLIIRLRWVLGSIALNVFVCFLFPSI